MTLVLEVQEVAKAADDVGSSGFGAGLILVGAGFALIPIARALLAYGIPKGPVFFARWGFGHVLTVAAIAFGTLLVAGPILSATSVGALVATLAFLGIGAALAGRTALRLHPEGLGALGFRKGHNLRSMLAGLAAYVVVFPALAGLGWIWPRLADWIELDATGRQEVMKAILALEGGALFFAVFVACVAGPLLEEVLFRGFLQPLLVQNLHERGGIVVTSLLFAVLHGAVAFLPIFGFSLLLGAIQLRSQRIAAAWVVHAAHNGLTLYLGFHFPELLDSPPLTP